MSNGWIKLQRFAEELLDNDQDSYLLMSQIAFRALRKESIFNKHNLKPGQALIGDYLSCGLSEQRYRDAKTRIEKKYKFATFKGTNKGTIATLLNSEFCDINLESENEQKNETRTNRERTENEQRTTKEEEKKLRNEEAKKKEKNKKENSSKIQFRDFITLTQSEYDSLKTKYGIDLFNSMLDILNSYKGRSGAIYKSDYHAMSAGSWVLKEAEKQKSDSKTESKEPKFSSSKTIVFDEEVVL